ncbi:MAG: 5-(carboxyamino)imidazole ribonucleotide synthase [Ignavibacteriaceae bacterium]|nr:5-(carboxyamino)imidazole ribonucleotide synthase [Ignavibacteriaceae bacterium]
MNKRKCIGILGGGQLARMTAYQAYKLGFDVAILEKEKKSPAGQLTKNEFVGWVDDKKLLKKFTEICDVVTLENEFIDAADLNFIEDFGKPVFPSSATISLIQDKYIQKQTLNNHSLPVPKFTAVTGQHCYNDLKNVFGKKFLLKSRKMGYDGYGNYLVKNENDFIEGTKKLSSRHSEIMAEEFIKFEKELAVMLVRTAKEIVVYPVVETIQKNHICHTVLAPASIQKKIERMAKKIAVQAVKAVNGFGIFGIEMFLTKDGKVYINEIAPRPHNSGHYTIEACVASQFENHVRAAFNLPLGNATLNKPAAVMINLLGKKEGEGVVENYSDALKNSNVHLHIYGKAKSRMGRKMGHITLLGKNLDKIYADAKKIEKKIII